ncbi:MAG: DUF2059 domain-containing protein [Alphaproteobacteria bacterium]|nr:DUF2059 domain-containing protein [Alphaproteobacteria bacterium]MCL2505049.1 DUF2059 domain-containing protein [Alphaproteobacteria bacterium]
MKKRVIFSILVVCLLAGIVYMGFVRNSGVNEPAKTETAGTAAVADTKALKLAEEFVRLFDTKTKVIANLRWRSFSLVNSVIKANEGNFKEGEDYTTMRQLANEVFVKMSEQNIAAIQKEMAQNIAVMFSTKELKEMLAFFSSDIGKKYLSNANAIQREELKAVNKTVLSLSDELNRELKDTFVQRGFKVP